ncbi:hypothetical protein [Megasphaera elsdenii]|uniref:hypothetical protein n=1 Tax=Megasphaera elsdenii TaxID=907 RepID=UPI00242C4B68|nr:hypothetical protein [Megasphaera elsdenii]
MNSIISIENDAAAKAASSEPSMRLDDFHLIPMVVMKTASKKPQTYPFLHYKSGALILF